MNNALTGDVNDYSKIEYIHFHNGEHLSAGTCEDSNLADETENGGVIISKLSFIVGQTTHLVCNLITRFQRRGRINHFSPFISFLCQVASTAFYRSFRSAIVEFGGGDKPHATSVPTRIG